MRCSISFLEEGIRSCNRDWNVTATTHCSERVGGSDRDQAEKKILFIDSADIIAVEAEGNYVLLQHESSGYLLREVIFNDGGEIESVWSLVNAAFVEGSSRCRPRSTCCAWGARNMQSLVPTKRIYIFSPSGGSAPTVLS